MSVWVYGLRISGMTGRNQRRLAGVSLPIGLPQMYPERTNYRRIDDTGKEIYTS